MVRFSSAEKKVAGKTYSYYSFSFALDAIVSGYNNKCPTHSPSSFERMVDLNSDSFWQHEELWIQSLKVTALSAFNPDDSELKRQ